MDTYKIELRVKAGERNPDLPWYTQELTSFVANENQLRDLLHGIYHKEEDSYAVKNRNPKLPWYTHNPKSIDVICKNAFVYGMINEEQYGKISTVTTITINNQTSGYYFLRTFDL